MRSQEPGEQYMTLGKRIRERRQSMKVTQQELAKALGLTSQHVSAIEQDKRSPSVASLATIAEELGVSIDYLVTGREGIITDTIPAIKADKKLKLEVKRALITLVRALRGE
jgi:transcriptional regulator with XRE-family HTH domain